MNRAGANRQRLRANQENRGIDGQILGLATGLAAALTGAHRARQHRGAVGNEMVASLDGTMRSAAARTPKSHVTGMMRGGNGINIPALTDSLTGHPAEAAEELAAGGRMLNRRATGTMRHGGRISMLTTGMAGNNSAVVHRPRQVNKMVCGEHHDDGRLFRDSDFVVRDSVALKVALKSDRCWARDDAVPST